MTDPEQEGSTTLDGVSTPSSPTDPRPHFRVAHGMSQHPKILAAPDPAHALAAHVAAIDHCYENGSDGHFNFLVVQRLANVSDTTVKAMIENNLWHDEGHDCPRCPQPRKQQGYLHDYLSHQRSGAMAKQISGRKRTAGQAGADKRWAKHRKAQAAREERLRKAGVLPPLRPDVEALCALLAELMVKNGCKAPAITKAWRDACRLMIDKDGRTPAQIENMIRWCQDGPHDDDRAQFWRSNILSMPKLRTKYDQMRLQRLGANAVATRRQMSPADQRVTDNQSLYEKYARDGLTS